MNHWSVITLGIGVLLATVALGDDDTAITALKNAGATVERDESLKGKPVVLVRYNLRQITDEGLDALKELEVLPAIELTGTGDSEVTPAILKALQNKKSLKRLSIAYAKISEQSAGVLASLRSLDDLELRVQVEVSPAAFGELYKLTNLKQLTLSDRLVSDAVLEDLPRLPALRTLNLRSIFVTDSGIAELKRLKNLQTLRIFLGDEVTPKGMRLISELRLNDVEITYFNPNDAGLKDLRKLDSLKILRLMNARNVTDQAIPFLSEMTSLKELEIVGVKLSEKGVKELKNALPACKIKQGTL